MSLPSQDDPLLNALVFFGKVYSRPISTRGVLEGLPLVEGRLTPELFPRAAARCGFESRMVKRALKDLHAATLPVVLILKSNDAVVLTRMGGSDQGRAEVIVLSTGSGVEEMDLAELEEVVLRNRHTPEAGVQI